MSLLYWDAQNWTQYCRGGLTSAEQGHPFTQTRFSCSVLSCARTDAACRPYSLVCQCSPSRKERWQHVISLSGPLTVWLSSPENYRRARCTAWLQCAVALQKVSRTCSPGRQCPSFSLIWTYSGTGPANPWLGACGGSMLSCRITSEANKEAAYLSADLPAACMWKCITCSVLGPSVPWEGSVGFPLWKKNDRPGSDSKRGPSVENQSFCCFFVTSCGTANFHFINSNKSINSAFLLVLFIVNVEMSCSFELR